MSSTKIDAGSLAFYNERQLSYHRSRGPKRLSSSNKPKVRILVRPSDILSFPLLSDDFDDDPLGALPIEFAGEKARPAAKVDFAIGDGQNNLVIQQKVFEVGLAFVQGLSGNGDRRDFLVQVTLPIL
jgi:hypothetical protein